MRSPLEYWTAVAVGAVVCVVLCTVARRGSPRSGTVAGRCIAVVLAVDAAVFVATPVALHTWTVQRSIPLSLCDIALIVAAFATWWPQRQLLVELTYFWGLAGTLQAVATPDLTVGFPHIEFFEFVVGHLGIVIAALFLVVGLRRRPRRGAVPRVWLITAAYTAVTGAFDALTGSNYFFLARPPGSTTLLSALGPWPWYIVSAAPLAYVLLLVLDLPFRRSRRAEPPAGVVPPAGRLAVRT